jgi:hypothetical protein
LIRKQHEKIQRSLPEAHNVTNDDFLLYLYVFVLEYSWNEIEPHPDQTMTSVIDWGFACYVHGASSKI